MSQHSHYSKDNKKKSIKSEESFILYLPIQMYVHTFNVRDYILTAVYFMWLSLLILMQLLFMTINTNHAYLFIFPTVCRWPSGLIYYDHKDVD